MGKKKTVIIDDSQPVTEEVKKEPRKKILEINQEEKTAKTANEEKPRERKKILGINQEKEEKKETKATEETKDTKVEKAAETPIQGKKVRSKRYLEVLDKVEKNKLYPIPEAISLVKEVSFSKFPGSLEIHINTSSKNLRGLVTLPFSAGKKLKIVAFGKNAAESGADIIGDDEALKEIEKGKIGFDVLITTPEWMPKLARAAKVLGPRGLMPNPKNGTITDDLKKAVAEVQGGKTEYKTEKSANVVHLSIGKLNQPDEELLQNTKILLSTIGKTRIKKVSLAPTMGPAVKLDLSTL